MQILEINEIEQLAPFRDAWRELLEATPRASFFQSLDWLEIYWRSFGGAQKLRTLIVQRDGRPLGIVALTVRKEQSKVGVIRTLTYPLDGWSSFYGPIGPQPAACLEAAFDHLRRTRRDWDVIDLRWIRAIDRDATLTERCLTAVGLEAHTRPYEQAAVIETHGAWDEYWRGIDSHQRSNLRRGEKRLQALGEVQFTRYRPAGESGGEIDPRWDLYEACEEVAAKSWQGAADDGTTLSSEGVRDCYREAHPVVAAAGALDIGLLSVERRPIAFAYGYQFRGAVYVIKVGFDPKFSQAGAGKILLLRLIRDSFERGDAAVDLGPESFHYKRFWLNRVETSYRATHFAPASPRAQALRLARWVRALAAPPTDAKIASGEAAIQST